MNAPENAYAVKYALKAVESELRQVKDKVRKQLQGKGSYARWLRVPLPDLTEKIIGEVSHIVDLEAAKGRIAFFRSVCDAYLVEERNGTPGRGQVFNLFLFLFLFSFLSLFFFFSPYSLFYFFPFFFFFFFLPPSPHQGFWSMIQSEWKGLGRLTSEDFKRHHDNLVREDLLKYTSRSMHTANVPTSIGDYDIELSPSNVVMKK